MPGKVGERVNKSAIPHKILAPVLLARNNNAVNIKLCKTILQVSVITKTEITNADIIVV